MRPQCILCALTSQSGSLIIPGLNGLLFVPLCGLTDEAGLSGPLRRTAAPEAVDQVLAGSTVTAGVHQTLVHIWKTKQSPPGHEAPLEARSGCDRRSEQVLPTEQEGPVQPGAQRHLKP